MLVTVKPNIYADLIKAGLDLPKLNRWEEDKPQSINLRKLKKPALDKFEDVIEKTPEGIGVRRQISSWRNAVKDPLNAKPKDLKVCASALTDFIVDNSIRGWLFGLGGEMNAHRVENVVYKPTTQYQQAHVAVTLSCEGVKEYNRGSFTIHGSDLKGKTLVETLTAQGFQKETTELIKAYDEMYGQWREVAVKDYGTQYLITQRTDWRKEKSWWSSQEDDDEKIDLAVAGGGKVIIDHPSMDKSADTQNQRRSRGRDHGDDDGEGNFQTAVEEKVGEEDAVLGSVPCDLYVRAFHLDAHATIGLHVQNLTKYEYDTKIREKLILPDETTELLDTLTEELDLVQEDVIQGKTGGNVILLSGGPGLGKTLTAEVYAEWRKAPLYKLHSGHLGSEPTEINKNLRKVFERVARWQNVIVLFDEFDVFGRARGEDLMQNAVVAIFLRAMEYQNGTIFLTTNRYEEMDDAILSRCAAVLSYDKPTQETIEALWTALSKQFLPNLPKPVIKEMVKMAEKYMPSGRDIKAILRLANRYERTGKKLTVELLTKCARFRGVQLA